MQWRHNRESLRGKIRHKTFLKAWLYRLDNVRREAGIELVEVSDYAMSESVSRFEAICETVHEAIRAWSKANGQAAQPHWNKAPDWMKTSTQQSVQNVLDNPQQAAGTQHTQWMDHKTASGWRFGPVKDGTLKTHPMMVPFEDLPVHEKKKDSLIIAIVRTLMD